MWYLGFMSGAAAACIVYRGWKGEGDMKDYFHLHLWDDVLKVIFWPITVLYLFGRFIKYIDE